MRRILVLFCFLGVGSFWANAQVVSSCVQTLRLAQSTYEQGRLHELPGLLDNCLKNGFTDEEKRQAYMLLTMAYIYLEEPEKADDAMLSLLRTDHFFEVDPNVHPAEFISLYNKFRVKSLFRVGLILGPTYNYPTIAKDYSIGQIAPGTGKYTPGIGFQIGASFEKDVLKKFTLAPEFVYAIRSFSYTADVFKYDRTGEVAVNLVSSANINRFELNPIIKYRLNDKSKWNPFILAGGSINLLTKYGITDAQLNRLDLSGTVTGPEIDALSSGNKLTYSALLGFGGRLRLGGLFLLADVRYQYGLSNFINSSNRTVVEASNDYALPNDDFTLNSFTINIGVLYAYFSPKKLIK